VVLRRRRALVDEDRCPRRGPVARGGGREGDRQPADAHPLDGPLIEPPRNDRVAAPLVPEVEDRDHGPDDAVAGSPHRAALTYLRAAHDRRDHPHSGLAKPDLAAPPSPLPIPT